MVMGGPTQAIGTRSLNPDQWVDADGDGYGDNYLFDLDEYQYHVNQSGDASPTMPHNGTTPTGTVMATITKTPLGYVPSLYMAGLLLPAANHARCLPTRPNPVRWRHRR